MSFNNSRLSKSSALQHTRFKHKNKLLTLKTNFYQFVSLYHDAYIMIVLETFRYIT
jgi:hypothetical protein